MKERVLSTLLLLLLLLSAAGNAEETPKLLESYASRDSQYVTFAYPEGCTVEVEEKLGTHVFLDAETYAAVIVTEKGQSGIEALQEAIGDSMLILTLSDDMQLYAAHATLHRPLRPECDIVELGVNLPDGTGLLIMSMCPRGETAVYDLLLTIVGSVTDETPLQTWLVETWFPSLTEE